MGPRKNQTPNIVAMKKPNLKYLEKLDPRKNQNLDVGPLKNQTTNMKQVLRKTDLIFLVVKAAVKLFVTFFKEEVKRLLTWLGNLYFNNISSNV